MVKVKELILGDKHESAVKEAESDARKRAFMQFGSHSLDYLLYDRSKAWKNPKKDRTPVSTQNLTVVAKDAILKADTRQRLDKCAESL